MIKNREVWRGGRGVNWGGALYLLAMTGGEISTKVSMGGIVVGKGKRRTSPLITRWAWSMKSLTHVSMQGGKGGRKLRGGGCIVKFDAGS